MTAPRSVLVVQTAFAGDVVLTLPLIQLLHASYPRAAITAVTIPAAAELLAHHPALERVIAYDKRGADRGIGGFLRLAARLRPLAFDVALIPHRSVRSALICRAAGIPVRIGFHTSAGRMLLTHVVRYVGTDHEIARNIALASPLGISSPGLPLPRLFPSAVDRLAVDAFLRARFGPEALGAPSRSVAVAPGSVWPTKRWPEERYLSLVRLLLARGWCVVLVGGAADRRLCARLEQSARDRRVADAAGRFSLLESAALISRCAALVSNDSAPVHMAVAMDVPVVALFGPTLPSFGFAPAGPADRVVETEGLACRPCSRHGGMRCPTGTFDCMKRIEAERVRDELTAVARKPDQGGAGDGTQAER